MITKEVADKLKETNIDKVCVSIDGSSAEIHDASRGHKGTFPLTIQGIKNLLEANINVDGIILKESIRFSVATKKNSLYKR